MQSPVARRYLDCLKLSGLVDPATLTAQYEALRADGQPPTLQRLIRRLVENDLLTTWQHQQLAAGKKRGFYFDRFKLLAPLGRGGMSVLYRAEHPRLKRQVALKILDPRYGDSPVHRAFFRREARLLGRLDHPHVVRALDAGEFTGTPYLVMDYVSGDDLQKAVEQTGPLCEARAAKLMVQAAAGLAHIHRRRVVHRDVKPANLRIDCNGHVKVLDLGLAYAADDPLAEVDEEVSASIIGTADYVAPEQATPFAAIDERADLYSLGGTLYFLLTGQPPFPHGTIPQKLNKHRDEQPEPVESLRPDVCPELRDVVGKLLEKRPSQRFPSATVLGNVLRKTKAFGSRTTG